ncbi:hypothetical protein PDJAM_G00175400 [Pangasius djambal]|uniref:Uncharacterized protein n=1 Tax=Pangasius djambal TaxID=1691987 RepID=A0ACC5ZMV0_9TELE|nr:hypothetical protein [Pangasius djambal]
MHLICQNNAGWFLSQNILKSQRAMNRTFKHCKASCSYSVHQIWTTPKLLAPFLKMSKKELHAWSDILILKRWRLCISSNRLLK